ncbi:hypothetical protein [Actinomadura keratinilytica]|jgi:hypothetical protein|uniref:DUF4232 domain-containing protein n=1 Tax=Actinomadura keratinilytica TaxID=547461 RepID=A0ABP7Z7K6_9ACTN
MDADTGRDGGAADRYWRRRAAVLAVVLGVLVALAYGCGGDDDAGRDAADGPADAPTVPSAAVTVTVTATRSVRAAPARPEGDACAREDLVVGLAMARDTYTGAQRPRFIATVVNTGPDTCTFTGALGVRVTSGRDRVWSSARCGRGGSRERTLRRGIPHVETVTWDRRRSTGDCRGRGLPARPGTYVAAVRADGLRPATRVFHLR